MIADYYAMLSVDPKADRDTIEQALRRSQPQWSSRTRHPSKGTLYQSYLDQIPEIRRRLLGEPSDRVTYDIELAAARQAERGAKLDELQRLVRLRAAKGGLTVSDRNLLRMEADRLGLSKDDLDRLAQPFPPLPEAPPEPPDDGPEPIAGTIEPATRRQIRIALEHLGRADLYDLLGLKRDAPASEIADRASAERQRWMQKAQVTAEKTAWLNAVSLAQSHLVNPEARDRYDRTLALEAEEAFERTVAFTIQGLAGLDDGTRGVLMQEAAALGIDLDRADRLIARACQRQGLDRRGGPAASNSTADRRWLRCRDCGGLTDYAWSEIHGSGGCRHCRAPLTWDCPVCQRTAWVDEPRCRHCRFPIALRDPLIHHFEAAQHAHKLRRLEDALAHLKRVQEFAPRHVGARKGVEKVLQQLAQTRKLQGVYETEKARRRLVAARAAVEAWSRLVEADNPEVREALAGLQRGLARAGALVAKARKLLPDDPDGARALYRQAMAIAVDLPEAHEGIRLTPPDGPTDLRAVVAAGRVRLRWSAPKPDGLGPVSYRILRKRQQAPAHAEDGLVVAEVGTTEWEDTTPKPGEVFGYAVFAQRQGVSSVLGVSAGPFLVADDVRDVRVEARSGEVRLSWSPPPGALGVRVVRKPGAPVEGPRDGIPIETLDDGALDRGLDDGRVYHYGLFTLWPAPGGTSQTSRGVFVSAVPQNPARPIDSLRIVGMPDDRLRIGWNAPPVGHVRIFRSEHPFPHPPGERRSAAEVDRIDASGTWLDENAPDHTFDKTPNGLGVCHYTPVTFAAGQATVGHPLLFSRVPDPTDLRVARAVHEPGRVFLRWRWDPHGTQCLVAACRGRFPDGPEDPEALVFPVQQEEYARLRSFSVALPTGGEPAWHLAVFTVVHVEGRRLTSPGLDPTSRAVVPGPDPDLTVSYDLKPPLLGRRWEIAFRTDPPGSMVPPTALVAHPRAVPLSADDGQILAQFPPCRDGHRQRFHLPPGFEASHVRLFPDPRANPDGLHPFRLRHPEVGATRV